MNKLDSPYSFQAEPDQNRITITYDPASFLRHSESLSHIAKCIEWCVNKSNGIDSEFPH
jgi:hypothetical protein